MLQGIDLSRVDLNLLVLFEAVMRERHVGRTAARLHLSPSAISHGLGRLRRMLHDPLFLKHPKGVVPTERAEALAAPITEILQRVQSVIADADGFDPSVSTRRFTLGSPDAVLTVVLPPLMVVLAKAAPRIDLSVRTMLPMGLVAELDARRADIVVQPATQELPQRFTSALLYEEEFAIAMRAGHPLGTRPSLARYCAASHVLVSNNGDPHGAVDVELAKLGRSRRVAVTVTNFLFALALVADSDLVAAVPRQSSIYARRFGIVLAEPPPPLAPLMRAPINVIATRAAMADAGVAWLFRAITECMPRKRPSRNSLNH